MLDLTDEKLVRDKIPEIILSEGVEPNVRIADSTEIDELLRRKIVEEAQELLESGSDEEIADVLEAVDSLLTLRGVSQSSIRELQIQKRTSRGGFQKRYVLITDESEVE